MEDISLTWHLESWCSAETKTRGYDHKRTTQEKNQIPRSSVEKGFGTSLVWTMHHSL